MFCNLICPLSARPIQYEWRHCEQARYAGGLKRDTWDFSLQLQGRYL